MKHANLKCMGIMQDNLCHPYMGIMQDNLCHPYMGIMQDNLCHPYNLTKYL